MECLLLPTEPTGSLAKIPFYDTYRYDGGYWSTFPRRFRESTQSIPKPENEDDIRLLYRILLKSLSHLEFKSFVQAWLFFGLVSEMTGGNYLDDVTVEGLSPTIQPGAVIEDIYKGMTLREVHGTQFHVTSAGLLQRMERAWSPLPGTINYILRRVLNMQRFLSQAFIMFNCLEEEFVQDLRYSIGATLELISRATFIALRRLGLPQVQQLVPFNWSKDYYLMASVQNRMLSNGWCISDLTRIKEKFKSLQTLHFLSHLDRSRPERVPGHRMCSQTECHAYQIDMSEYEVGHVQNDCSCQPIGVDDEKVVDILNDGEKFPVLKVVGSEDNLKVEVSEVSPDTPYIAISHVWADGLGNPKENTLRRCQMLRLRHLTRKLNITEDDSDPHIWLDTLCSPAKEGKAKDKAIAKIRFVYRKAACVLVLDSSLSLYRLSEMDIVEKLGRIFTAGWFRRLWTLQEGALAQKLYFQFAEEAANLDQLQEDYSDTLNLLRQQVFLEDIGQELQGLWRFFRAEKLDIKPADAGLLDLQILDRSLLYRSVSVPSDEPLCIATLMSINLDMVQKVNKEGRMAKVWELLASKLKGLPAAVIFSEDDRLCQNGYGWAPASLLTTKETIQGPGYRLIRWYGTQRGQKVPQGLQVVYPGFKLSRKKSYEDDFSISPWPTIVRLIEVRLLFKDQTGKLWQIVDTAAAKHSTEQKDQSSPDNRAMRASPLHDSVNIENTISHIVLQATNYEEVAKASACRGILVVEDSENKEQQGSTLYVQTQRHILLTPIESREAAVWNLVETLAHTLRRHPITAQLQEVVALSSSGEPNLVSSHVGDDIITMSVNDRKAALTKQLRVQAKLMMAAAIAADENIRDAIDSMWSGHARKDTIWVLILDWFNCIYEGHRLPDDQIWVVD